MNPTRQSSSRSRVTQPQRIADDTVLKVEVPDSSKVTFAGPTGTLWLDKPSTLTGKVADFGAQEGIDLPSIPFGVHTTLGYSENSSDTGGTAAHWSRKRSRQGQQPLLTHPVP